MCLCPEKWNGHGEPQPDDKRPNPDCYIHGEDMRGYTVVIRETHYRTLFLRAPSPQAAEMLAKGLLHEHEYAILSDTTELASAFEAMRIDPLT